VSSSIYADDDSDISDWLGKMLLVSILIGVAAAVFIILQFDFKIIYVVACFFAFIFLFQFFVYITIYFKMENRKSKIEKALPDALQLIASNLQAGMTPYSAIKISARKEFGPLSDELIKATSQALGTKNFSEELMKIGDRVDSPTVKRSLKLITSSIHSGGHLASLLEDLSEDIAETQSLKTEMVTNTKTYVMFIMFTIIIGAPLLLSISVHFVGMVQGMQSQTTLSTDEFGLGFLTGEIEITPEFLTDISLVVLFFTSFLACLLTGVIISGKKKEGLRYVPFVVASSITLFFIAKYAIGTFFETIG
jgi:hypothetical protein